MDPVIAWIARTDLALLFAAAAVHKVRDPRAFLGVVRGYRIAPERLVWLVAPAVIALEAALVPALLAPNGATRAALAAAALLFLYSLAIAINLARGRRSIDCGCLGPAGRQSLSAGLLGRNAILMAAALLAAWPASSRPLVWVDTLSITAGALSLALLFYAANTLGAHAVAFAHSAGGAHE